MALSTYHKPQPGKEKHEDLLLRVGKGQDRTAFVELFHYYAPRIKSYLLRHGASDTAAEEAVQNTFVTIWEKAASYNPAKAAASTWIFTIARNKRIDALRKDRYLETNTDSMAMANAVAAEEKTLDTAELENLQAAITALSPEQEKLVRMAFFEDKSHRKISDETKLPLGTVKSRLRLALIKLKKILKKGEDHA